MKRAIITAIMLCLLLSQRLCSQAHDDFAIGQFIADIYEHYTEETDQDIDYDTFLEELSALSLNPINLNNTNREALSRLMFLSDIQIENLLFHLYKFGKMDSLYELQLVSGFDMTDIRRMLPFVCIASSDEQNRPFYFRELFTHGKNDLILRFDLIPERKAGYIRTDSGAYLGDPVYHHLKYRYQYGDRVFLNFTAEKDAGETFFNTKHPGYDFYSGSMQLRETGFLKNLILGDFQAGFGQGLVINQAFGRGKSAMTTNLMRTGNGFKRSGSVNEYNFLRGVAVSLQHRQWVLHAFYANNKHDGVSEPGELTGLYTTGYHRTADEMQKKNTVLQQFTGVNIGYQGNNFQLGFTSAYTHLNRAINPGEYPYNLYYFRGKQQWVNGLHYRLRQGKLIFFGETAYAGERGLATVNGITIAPVSRLKLALLHRYYAPEYDALFASAFSENSRVSNENGFYAGIEVLPFKKWKVAFYADSYRFPWLKFGVDAPAEGRDLLLHADFQHNRYVRMQWRFKFEQTQITKAESFQPLPSIRKRNKASLRYQLFAESGNFLFRHTIDGNIVQEMGRPAYGLSAMQDISYQCTKIPLRIDLRYQYFDAVSYDNRIYAFEKDLLYAFSAPAFSGLGSRYYLNFNYEINRDLSFYFKFAQVLFADDSDELGSGNELIQGNRKTEIKLLFRWKFRWK